MCSSLSLSPSRDWFKVVGDGVHTHITITTIAILVIRSCHWFTSLLLLLMARMMELEERTLTETITAALWWCPELLLEDEDFSKFVKREGNANTIAFTTILPGPKFLKMLAKTTRNSVQFLMTA